jgi:hypothetical protein
LSFRSFFTFRDASSFSVPSNPINVKSRTTMLQSREIPQ